MVLIFERGWGGSSPPFRMLKFFVSHVHFWISLSSFYSYMWFRFASDWVVFAFLSSRLTVSYCWLPFTQPKVYFVVWLNQVIVINCCFLQFQFYFSKNPFFGIFSLVHSILFLRFSLVKCNVYWKGISSSFLGFKVSF